MVWSWLGPFRIIARLGEHTFQVRMGPHDLQAVHVDQIKPCWTYPPAPHKFKIHTPLIYRKGDPHISTFEGLVGKSG